MDRNCWKFQSFVYCFWLLFESVLLYTTEDNHTIEQALCQPIQLESSEVNLILFSNTTYLVHPGNFCVRENIEYVRIYGDNATSSSVIKCLLKENTLLSRGFGFINIKNLRVENVIFEDCGGVIPLSKLNFAGNTLSILANFQMPSTLFCNHCFNTTLRNVAITNYFGYAVVAFNLLGVSILDGLLITSNKQVNVSSPCLVEEEYICRGSGVLIEFADSNLTDQGISSSVEVSNSHFASNQINLDDSFNISCTDIAFYDVNILQDSLPNAGAVTVVFEQTFKATVTIIDSMFVDNSGICYGSSTAFYLSLPSKSVLDFYGCTFIDNGSLYFKVSTNQNFFGSAITVFMLFQRDQGMHIECVSITNTSFSSQISSNIPYLSISQLHDSRGYCTAVLRNITSISDSYLLHAESVGGSRLLFLLMEDIKLTGLYPNTSQVSSSRGVIELVNIQQANLNGTSATSCRFRNLFGPVISAVNSFLHLSGNMSFENNHGPKWVDGAAIQMYESSMKIYEPTFVVFEKNTAIYGGAVYSSGIAEKLSPFCSIQYHAKHIYTVENISDMNIRFFFRQNSALLGGNSLFADNLYDCSVQISKGIKINQFNVPAIYDALFIVEDQVNNSLQEISSIGHRVCICLQNTTDNSNTLECNGQNIHNAPIHTYPGKAIQLSIIAVDKRRNPIYSTVFLTAKEFSSSNQSEDNWQLESGQEVIQTNKYDCKTISVTILPGDNVLNVNGILNAYVPESDMSTDIPIFLDNCPWGFTKNSGSRICTCSEFLMDFGVKCDVDSGTVNIADFSWIGLITQDNENIFVAYSVRCPLSYCRNETKGIVLQLNSSICDSHREGVLCGRCSRPYSSVIGSKDCLECSNWYLLTILLYALLGLLLVFILFALKLTITMGTMNGVIFYANFLYISRQRFLGSPELLWLQVVFGFINLRLGFPLCLYDNMNAVVSSHLSFIFPVYLWLINGLLILISRYSRKVANILGATAVQVLATLIHLSFNTLLASTVDALTYIDIELEKDGKKNTLSVWYVDGNMTYLDGAHLSLFLLATVTIFLFLLPYTTLLTGIKMFSWFRIVNRFMPLIDAFCAPFKDKWRFWFGARLWVLVFLYTGHALLSEHTYGLYFMKLVVMALFLSAQMAIMPFKNLIINLLDSFFMLNCLILSATTLYIRDLDQLRYGTGALVGMAFLVYFGILFYHTYKALKLCSHREIRHKSVKVEKYKPIPDQPEPTSKMEDSSKVTFQVLTYHPEKLRESILGSKNSVNDA